MEVFTMARQSKREYLRSIYQRYRRARRAQKTAMLEEFCKVCGYNRKYAIWLLSHPLPKAVGPRRTTSRSPTYSKAMVGILAKVWQACGYLCSQRLKVALPHWLPWIRKHFELRAQWEQQLLAISPRQMDRRLNPYKRTLKRRLYGTTPRHGSLSSSTEEFIAAVRPKLAVFSVGHRNPFGLPREEVISRYQAAGAEIFRTDEDGAIVVETDGERFRYWTYRRERRGTLSP